MNGPSSEWEVPARRPGGQPEHEDPAAAQALLLDAGCGGVTFQLSSYQARREKEPHACTELCGMKSWVKDPAAPPPAGAAAGTGTERGLVEYSTVGA